MRGKDNGSMDYEIIRNALGGPGDDRPPGVVANASVRALDSLFSQLEPLVGVQGVRALYARCLHLTRPAFQWPAASDLAPREELLSVIRGHLAVRAAADAQRASEALLNAFADLLVSLIGAPLTLRLLQSAWGSPAAEKASPENSK